MIFVPACLMLAIALAGPAAYPLASAAGSLPGASLDRFGFVRDLRGDAHDCLPGAG
jgi:hypothetical protein